MEHILGFEITDGIGPIGVDAVDLGHFLGDLRLVHLFTGERRRVGPGAEGEPVFLADRFRPSLDDQAVEGDMAYMGRLFQVDADFLIWAHLFEAKILDRTRDILGPEQLLQLIIFAHPLDHEVLVALFLLEHPERLLALDEERRFTKPGQIRLDDHLIDPVGQFFRHPNLAAGEPGTFVSRPADIELSRPGKRCLLHADDDIGELLSLGVEQFHPGRFRLLALGILDPDLGILGGPRGLGLDGGDLGQPGGDGADGNKRHPVAVKLLQGPTDLAVLGGAHQGRGAGSTGHLDPAHVVDLGHQAREHYSALTPDAGAGVLGDDHRAGGKCEGSGDA